MMFLWAPRRLWHRIIDLLEEHPRKCIGPSQPKAHDPKKGWVGIGNRLTISLVDSDRPTCLYVYDGAEMIDFKRDPSYRIRVKSNGHILVEKNVNLREG